MKKTWGFDTKELDTKVRPQDDFYHYANGGWLSRTTLPKEESRWGTFMMLRKKTDEQLHALVQELSKMKRAPKGSPEQLVGDFFASGMDEKRREKLGLTPLAPFFARILKLTKREQLTDLLVYLHTLGVGVLWSADVDQDLKQSERYALYLGQGGLSLGDRDYYLKDDPESKRVRTAYEKHLLALLKLSGHTAAESARRAGIVLAIETELAQHSMDKVDARDFDKIYHKMTAAKLAKRAPSIDWVLYLKKLGAQKAGDLLITQPEFFTELERTLSKYSMPEWQVYFEWHVLNEFANLLSPRFVRQSFAFYGKVMSGVTAQRPLWRRVLSVVNGSLDEELGKLYVQRHFPPEAKVKMMKLVADLFDAYEARLRALTWMSSQTKVKAVRKLRAMHPKIGYPNKWKGYRGLTIVKDDYVGNVLRTIAFEHKREMKRLGKKIDRDEWHMSPQTVNAYFAPTLNDIVFPAAILQPPFFDLQADDAHNYGAIGTVIGHEMTHGFDDQGAKFDASGNMRTWWSKEDKTQFEKKTALLAKQFDAYTVADGVHVNGKLTLGENVADLGGAAIAYDAYKVHLEKHPEENVDIDGFSPTQRFFLGFALFERELSRPEFQKMQVLTDPHSPGIYRINGPASNMEQFYKAFDVKKGDALYRAPSARAKIW